MCTVFRLDLLKVYTVLRWIDSLSKVRFRRLVYLPDDNFLWQSQNQLPGCLASQIVNFCK